MTHKQFIIGSMTFMTALIGMVARNMMQHADAADTTVDLTISPGIITIGSTGTFSLGTTSVSTTTQAVSNTFSAGNEFFVQDLKGSNTGYYTTLQISAMTGVNTSATIPAANIALSVSSNSTSLMAGTANTNVLANASNTLTTQTALNTPITFIERKDGANAGKIGKYGVLPTLHATIPAFQAADNYRGTVTFTLYDVGNP